MNNNQRRELKIKIKKVVEEVTNNTVISSKVLDDNSVECICKNKFSDSHIINVILSKTKIYITYDKTIIETVDAL